MVKIIIKDTGIKITCNTYEEAFIVYNRFGHQFTVVIEGEELKRMGPEESKNSNVKSYYAGYTRNYFKKYFKEA